MGQGGISWASAFRKSRPRSSGHFPLPAVCVHLCSRSSCFVIPSPLGSCEPGRSEPGQMEERIWGWGQRRHLKWGLHVVGGRGMERPCYFYCRCQFPSPFTTLLWPLSSVSHPGNSLQTDVPTAISPLPLPAQQSFPGFPLLT